MPVHVLEAVNQEGWPKWLSLAYDVFVEDEKLVSNPTWVGALKEWVDVERKFQFENPKGTKAFFPSLGRPALVQWWSQNGKVVKASPPKDMVDAQTFGKQWWDWWSVINPEWRRRDGAGRVISDGYEGEKEEKGKELWESFKKPGECGMLTVLLCLFYWYQQAKTEEERAEWMIALKDVAWVLERVNRNTK
ncbi:hypothetical protein K435DRAFT_670543 [Dendrothele bispora CBS 962.96]|uniref:Uncharacterized protein n=1 Tax=Dendrothele bispora (strain CBS 962.96) TaxID=1314807 RepID=A0A4S8LUL7_DENBC|nr:hypothetical protein K435DRAFT_670543 [Dendrothele bispora CBS 962.96]